MMEARAVFGSSPFGPDSIEVTATKEEWQAVIDEVLRGGWEPNEPSSSLVHWLINQGVYE